MTVSKSMLASSVVAFAAMATAASAADLPTKKAAPVEYVRVCSVHGAGFWYIPGTDTCVRIGGRVRAEFGYAQPGGFNGVFPFYNGAVAGQIFAGAPLNMDTATGEQLLGYPAQTQFGQAAIAALGRPFWNDGRGLDATGFEAEGRIDVDVRTTTEWGTLRAFIRYDAYRNSGPYTTSFAGYNRFYSTSNSFGLDSAYVQWALLGGAFTAGRAQSFFDFYTNDLNWTSIAGSDHKTQLFAYTATFGSGFSATLSMEDQTVTTTALWATDFGWYRTFSASPDYLAVPYWYGGTIAYGGTRVPDIVTNLRVDQGWGSAQLSAALHQSRWSSFGITGPASLGQLGFTYADPFFGSPYVNPDTGAFSPNASDDWGWAVQAGVKINLPALGNGDILYLQAAYADGATAYLGVNNIPLSLGYSLGQVGDQYLFPITYDKDGVTGYTGSFEQKSVKGYALTAAGLHYWTPTIRQAVFGSYLHLDNPTSNYFGFLGPDPAVDEPAVFSWYKYGPHDTTVWQVGTNLIWSPVAGLDIGAEVGYVNVNNGPQPYAFYETADAAGFTTKSSSDRWYARFRIQRDF